tara:strand:- start:288 stop:404 length:117 start_codon:yes stop_codon:yes gene_type:complete
MHNMVVEEENATLYLGEKEHKVESDSEEEGTEDNQGYH